MTTEQMTIHKALAELKVIDDRIETAISSVTYVVANKHINKKISGRTIADFSNDATAAYRKAMDLGARRNAIKRAVVLSNATTHVTIAGKDYTVAEAIEMKNHGMDYKRLASRKLANDFRSAMMVADRNNGDALERRADEYIKNSYGEKADVKTLGSEALKARDEFIANQQFELVDPLNAKKEIEALEEEINSFNVEVDSALSVSNAITTIEVTY